MRIDSFFEKLAEYSIYVLVAFYSVSKAMIDICFTVTLCSWVIAKLMKREKVRANWDFALVSLSMAVIFSTLSFFVSHYPIQSIRGLGKHYEEVLFFLIILDRFQDRQKIRNLIKIGTVVLLVTCLDSLIQFVLGKDFLRGMTLTYSDVHVRLRGPFKETYLLANYLMGWAPLLLTILVNPIQTSKENKILLCLLLLIALFCLFHTQARGAWLSFALAFVFFAILQKHKLLLGFFTLAVIAGILFLPRNMIVHPDYFGQEQSVIERGVLWKRALDVIKARPLLGTGINTYVKSYHEFDTAKSWRVQNYYAHNSFLQLAAERGLPALFFLLAFIFSFFWKSLLVIKMPPASDEKNLLKGILMALLGLLILAVVDTVFEPLQTGMLIWFLFGLGFAVLRMAETQQKVRSA